jgi:D-alanine-D-alanine ligase
VAHEDRLHIAVLAGGATGEREVSMTTGRSVTAALEQRGHRVELVDLRPSTGAPIWGLGGQESSPLELLAGPLADVDVYFLALHGGAGEGGALQGFLETMGLAYTGSGVAASALCLDKLAFLLQMERLGLATSPRVVVPAELSADAHDALLQKALGLEGASRGLVVKPRHGGSSVATACLVPGPELDERLRCAVEAVHAQDEGPDEALIEVRVLGLETSCGLLEEPDGRVHSLPPIEIRPAAGGFFDYHEKYSSDGAQELCPAESIPEAVQVRVRQLALEVHRRTGCRGYSRVDFMLPGEDGAAGEPVLLESNTLPGLTPRSLFPKAAAAAGIEFPALCEALALAGLRAAAARR